MARIRTLKPEHRTHRKTGALSHIAYRLWVGMILEADDEGRLVCDTEQLRVTIFGYHPKVQGALIESSLSALAALGLLKMYAVDGARYAWFPSWHDHQVINRPTPSKLPPYADSVSAHGVLTESSRLKGREENGTERKGVEGNGGPVVMSDDQFLESLRLNPAYSGIDFEAELGKMDAWLSTPKARGRKKTRGFIVNWLNRADKAVASQSAATRINRSWAGKETGEVKL